MGTVRIWAVALTMLASGSLARGAQAEPVTTVPVGELPFVTTRITNDTDAALSLIVTSSLCAPRILLRPGQSAVVEGCFRWGLVYHTVAVFHRGAEVIERQHLLFLAKPGGDWRFYPLVSGGTAARVPTE